MEAAIVFDTEFTAWPGSIARSWRGPGEYKEIVQIGAITINVNTLEELSSLSVLIRPVLNPVLSDYFTRLTGISNALLIEKGVEFAEGAARFSAFVGSAKTFCYGRDDLIIAENAKNLGLGAQWQLPASTNLRYWLEKVGVPVAGVHSGELAAHVGAASQGRAHDAVTDSRSLAEAVRFLVAKGAPNPFKS